jgi:hypothetical protein
MKSLLDWLVDEVLAPCYRAVIPSGTVWEWADAHNVFLDEKATALPGYYDSNKTPWAREFMETFTDPRFDEDHAMKSSRVGLTEAALNVIRFMPEHAPGAALYAIDTAEEAKKISTDRLIPTLRTSAPGSITDDEDDVTRKVIRLRNMVIHVAGSYSPSIFRNKSLRFVCLDEVEVVEGIEGEGTLHDLARSRQSDVPGAKLFSMSKPRKWDSAHHREVATGTLSAFLVPCPHCGTFQELSFDGESPTGQLRLDQPLRPGEAALSPQLAAPVQRCGRLQFGHCKDLLGVWDLEKIERETFYECVCGCRIEEKDKPAMIRAGRWLATNPRPAPRKRSRHISDLYSLHERLTWGKLASIFVQAQGDPDKLLHFVNNHLGLPWRERHGQVGEEQVLECRGPYKRGFLPFEPDFVTLCADTQDAFWKYVVAGYRLSGERAVVRWGIAGTRADLLGELDIDIPLAADPAKKWLPALGLVDAGGHRTDEVYDLHLESAGRLWPCFGKNGPSIIRPIWFNDRIMHRFRLITIYFFHDDAFKRKLYLGSIARVREIKVAQAKGLDPAAQGLPPRLQIPGEPGDADLRSFVLELTSERMLPDGTWAKTRSMPNDFGDALKLCDVCFDYVKPAIMAERKAEAAEKAKADAAAAAKKPATL